MENAPQTYQTKTERSACMKQSDRDLILSKLYRCREEITNNLAEIESLLKIHFPPEHDIAYQHWIPQIVTALFSDTAWLPRGQYSMQDSIDHIKDIDTGSGVNKYIS